MRKVYQRRRIVVRGVGVEWAVASGDIAEAREGAKNIGQASIYHRDLMMACTQAQRPVEMDKIAREAELSVMREPDPEAWYHLGELMAYCGQKDAAIRLLRAAIERNHCAYETLQTDPLLVKLRGTHDFSELQSAAKQCQHVLVQRYQSSH